jgi:hypothetical protein
MTGCRVGGRGQEEEGNPAGGKPRKNIVSLKLSSLVPHLTIMCSSHPTKWNIRIIPAGVDKSNLKQIQYYN